jgi:cytochrome c
VVVAPDGEIVTAGADGKVYFLSPEGAQRGAVEASPTPITALAISHNGDRIAAASIGGSGAIIDRQTRIVARTLVGPGLPVWSVAFFPDNRTYAHRRRRPHDPPLGLQYRRADRHRRDRRF